jgi:hypothetical protein
VSLYHAHPSPSTAEQTRTCYVSIAKKDWFQKLLFEIKGSFKKEVNME